MADLMSAILKEEPPELSGANPQINPQLEKIVQRCLEKKPEMRFQTASDLGFALRTLPTPGSAGVSPATSAGTAARPLHEEIALLATDTSARSFASLRSQTAGETPALPGRWRERGWMMAAGVLGLIAVAMTMAYFNRPANSTRAVRLSFMPPEKLAFDNGRYDSVVVSPDGQKLVFTGRSADGKRQLYVRPLDSGEATLLPGTEDALAPFWSPDSRSLGFGAQGKLKRVELAGGRPQTLCDATRLQGGTWNREGVIVFAPSIVGRLYQVPATGGTPAPVTGLDPAQGLLDQRDPYFLPDGRHFLYREAGVEGEQRVIVGSLDTKEVKRILADAAPAVYAPPGWLLFVREGALVAQAFDATRLELKGEAIPLTNPVENFDPLAVPLSVSENGVLVWRGDAQHDYQLVWFDRTGKQESVLGPPERTPAGENPTLAPDGRNVAIWRRDPKTRNADIWTIDLLRNLPTRLTFDPAQDQAPIWSPDGSQVAFQSRRGGTQGFYQKAAGGGGEDSLLTAASGAGILSDWSRDGRYLLYSKNSEKTRRDVWALPLFGERQPYLLINSTFDEYQAQLSPDMRWLAYVSDESGSYEIYVQPFTADGKVSGDKKRISTSGGTQPCFSRNGQELFYVAADGQMMAVALQSGGATLEFEPPKALFKTRMLTGLIQSGTEYDVTADGQRFLIGTQVGEATPVSVILNWTTGLKK